jgi:hypothetical protein
MAWAIRVLGFASGFRQASTDGEEVEKSSRFWLNAVALGHSKPGTSQKNCGTSSSSS